MAAPEQDPAEHQPYVPAETSMPEFTWSAVLVGAALGIVFGASSLYLVLKVGMTVSASIPVAVLSITLFRLFSRVFKVRKATILENNIVQTTGSAGESIAFGVGLTMPAMMLLGFEMEIQRVMIVSVLGGALGILMMIPLRRAFIVKQHGRLPYPEGTACADVLIVGEQGGSSAKTVFVGFAVAAVYQFLWRGLRLWRDVPSRSLAWFKGAAPAIEVDPALLGVGYIIGTRIACVMLAGGVLASFVLVPMIRLFGEGLAKPLFPATVAIGAMDNEQIYKSYVLYIGAGAVAAGGIISLFQALPLIVGSIAAGVRDLRGAIAGTARARRTDRDLPLTVVAIGALVLVTAIWWTLPVAALGGWTNLAAAVLIVLFGFLFVTVSSRLTGEIGSSSNPISGMTVATLLLTCLVFLLLQWTDGHHRLIALTVAAVVCVASSNGGTTSQDLKTGFLVGATPKYQQWAILIGSISSALVIGLVLVVLNERSTIYTQKNLPTPAAAIDVAALSQRQTAPGDAKSYHVWQAGEGNPQAVPRGKYLVDDAGRIAYFVDPGINGTLARNDKGVEVPKYKAPKAMLMALITDGILTQKLPWTLVLLGASLAVVLELCGVPSLPFAVGVYLPLSSSAPIFVGGLARFLADKTMAWQGRKLDAAGAEMSPGVLLSTGFIAGGAITGVAITFLSFSDTIPQSLARWEYRTWSLSQAAPPTEAFRLAAEADLPAAAGANAPERQAAVAARAGAIAEVNPELAEAQLPLVAGTPVKLPQGNWPALLAFGLLGLVLVLTAVRAPPATGR